MSELAATNPVDRAHELLRLTRRLTALLEEETRHFEARRPQDAVALQGEKMQLANIYRRETMLAARDPARLSGVGEALKAELREATERFEAAVRANGAAVEAMKTLTEGIVKAIADAAARQKQAEGGYGPGARQPARIGAMALNQSA
ncbi:flagellar basal-body protein FlbY [Marinicauda algicola]|uniref:Flagellar basal-body protein FlbY n=1 Tax=Marinicauda algicola TaxID=2029849 RepID=A0A4S2H347_9PROT|nr:flagellar basal-body protein FlbY [Marinicauda algicola]TGY90025.1 flagellar basal-body protein FlbY [Marinicauda algicola]